MWPSFRVSVRSLGIKVNRQPTGKMSVSGPVDSASIIAALEAKKGGEIMIHPTASFLCMLGVSKPQFLLLFPPTCHLPPPTHTHVPKRLEKPPPPQAVLKWCWNFGLQNNCLSELSLPCHCCASLSQRIWPVLSNDCNHIRNSSKALHSLFCL